MDELLYHFTSKYHLPKILKCGYLKLTESNFDEKQSEINARNNNRTLEDIIKPVVWLTRNDGMGNGLEGGNSNKSEIKITVRKQKHYQPWRLWQELNRMNKNWAKRFSQGYNAHDWYVSEQIIPLNKDELIRIENTITGEILIDMESGVNSCEVTVIKPNKMTDDLFTDLLLPSPELKEGDVIRFIVETE